MQVAEKFEFKASYRKNIGIIFAVGVVVFLIGLWISLSSSHGGGHDPHGTEQVTTPVEGGEHGHVTLMGKIGAVFLQNSFFFLMIGLFGAFIIAVKYMANAGWYVVLKRIPEALSTFIPVGGALVLLTALLFGHDIYHHWWGVEGDPIIDGKRPVLNPMALFVSMGVFTLIWTLFATKFRNNSRKEDEIGGLTMHDSSIRYSAAFLPIFAFSFCFGAFQWLMSIEAHWFSTIYAVNVFAGLFLAGMTITQLLIAFLKDEGYMSYVTDEHIHDIGKFMFAFSIFWAYTWLSQFLLIYYANIPEETEWYDLRFEQYPFLFWLNFIVSFVIPFFALMTRNTKRKRYALKIIGATILLGRFLDLFILIVPGVCGESWDAGMLIMGLGLFGVFGAIFLFVVFRALGQANLVASNHPYLEESLHHDVGV